MKYLEFETPASKQANDLRSDFGLDNHGLRDLERVFWNLPLPALVEEAIFRNEGHLVAGGPFIVNTGKWSARAAQDKYIVHEADNADKIWWGEYNRPVTVEQFHSILTRLQAFLYDEEVWVQDCYVGAMPEYRMPIRVVTTKAWHSHFARNMFLTINDRVEQSGLVHLLE